MAFAGPQPPVGLGHGRGDLLFTHVAVDVEVEAAVVGVALSAEALVPFGKDVDGGVLQAVVAADAVDRVFDH